MPGRDRGVSQLFRASKLPYSALGVRLSRVAHFDEPGLLREVVGGVNYSYSAKKK